MATFVIDGATKDWSVRSFVDAWVEGCTDTVQPNQDEKVRVQYADNTRGSGSVKAVASGTITVSLDLIGDVTLKLEKQKWITSTIRGGEYKVVELAPLAIALPL